MNDEPVYGDPTAALRHELAELRAEAVDLRRENAALREFSPTPACVNSLPKPLRKYIHDLETRCDPAGEVAELSLAKDARDVLAVQNAALREDRDRLNWLEAHTILAVGAGIQWEAIGGLATHTWYGEQPLREAIDYERLPCTPVDAARGKAE